MDVTAELEPELRPGRAMGSVAFACGCDSLATFYRLFRATSGTPPGDFRSVAGSEA